MSEKKQPKLRPIIEGAESLSLGISMVVAVFFGFALGYGMSKLTGVWWLLFVGIFWGVAAAILNVYKAYQKQKKVFDELAQEPRYKNYQPKAEDDEDNEDYKN